MKKVDTCASLVFGSLVMLICVVLFIVGVNKIVDRAFPKTTKFQVGDCFQYIPEDLERWEDSGNYIQRVDEVGKKHYRFSNWTKSLPHVWNPSSGGYSFETADDCKKVTCPVTYKYEVGTCLKGPDGLQQIIKRENYDGQATYNLAGSPVMTLGVSESDLNVNYKVVKCSK